MNSDQLFSNLKSRYLL